MPSAGSGLGRFRSRPCRTFAVFGRIVTRMKNQCRASCLVVFQGREEEGVEWEEGYGAGGGGGAFLCPRIVRPVQGQSGCLLSRMFIGRHYAESRHVLIIFQLRGLWLVANLTLGIHPLGKEGLLRDVRRGKQENIIILHAHPLRTLRGGDALSRLDVSCPASTPATAPSATAPRRAKARPDGRRTRPRKV